jgi:hypothetical protein
MVQGLASMTKLNVLISLLTEANDYQLELGQCVWY